jgi:hypothetical protein
VAELKDYSGKFNPHIKLEDFSKNYLIKMMHAWSSAYLRMAELCNQAVMEKFGAEEALKCELAAYQKVADTTVPKIAKAAGIKVNDILDVIKVLQLCPDGPLAGVYEAEYDIKDKNHVVITITRCRTLDFCEKYAPDRVKTICHDIDIPINDAYVRALLPGGRLLPVRIPDKPRKDPREIPCVWEFRNIIKSV